MFVVQLPHVPSPTVALVSVSLWLHLLFLLLLSISIGVGATTGVLSCFPMDFYFVTTGWIFEIGLCEKFNQSINQSIVEVNNGVPQFQKG